jgi:Ca2+-binding RTX toxin-like protein
MAYMHGNSSVFQIMELTVIDYLQATVTATNIRLQFPGPEETTLSVGGAFNVVDGVISGTITSFHRSVTIIEDNPYYGMWRTTETYFDGGVYVSDIGSLHNMSKDSVMALLFGGDDVFAHNWSMGYAGNDRFLHPDFRMAIDGGDGFDTVAFDARRGGSIHLDLIKHANSYLSIEEFVGTHLSDTMAGSIDDDYLRGAGENDVLKGRDGNDILTGDSGDDRVFGGTGRDRLSGGQGNDVINGGVGIDILTGGADNDIFIYKDWTDSSKGYFDVITDFHREHDLLDLRGVDGNVDKPGQQHLSFIGSHAFTGSSGELRIVHSVDGVHVYADVDGDRVRDLDILVSHIETLTASDFKI